MATEYSIVSTQKYTYQDDTSRLVDGFRVWFYFTAFHETHYIFVPSLNAATVKAAIEKVLKDRKDLATL